MPYAKNTRAKGKKEDEEGGSTALQDAPIPSRTARMPDFGDDEDAIPEEKPEGAGVEDADGEEAALSEDEELDAADLNPFGDKWEE